MTPQVEVAVIGAGVIGLTIALQLASEGREVVLIDPAAPGSGGRAARLDAHHAVVAFVDEILGTQFLGVEVHRLEHVDHRRHEPLGQRER